MGREIMKFAYIGFLSLYSIIGVIGLSVTTAQMCKAKNNSAISSSIVQWFFFAGFIAQFIADGIRVIGG
jgi:uncharacterized membrane protein